MKNAKTVREEKSDLYFFIIGFFQCNLFGEVEELFIMLNLLNNLVTYYDLAIWSELQGHEARLGTDCTGTDITIKYGFYL